MGSTLKKRIGSVNHVCLSDNVANLATLQDSDNEPTTWRRPWKQTHFLPIVIKNDMLVRTLYTIYRVMKGYEVYFHLSGFINKQNFSYRSRENLQISCKRCSTVRNDIMVCHLILGVLGHYFFENNNGQMITF